MQELVGFLTLYLAAGVDVGAVVIVGFAAGKAMVRTARRLLKSASEALPMEVITVWVKTSFLIDCALLIGAALAGCAPAAHKPNIEHMLATAKTASDHEAIAQYYEQEAADDEAKYEEHRAEAGRYRHSPKFGTISAQHCYQLTQDYKQANQDASVLAAQHRKIAEEMNSADGTAAVPAAR